MNLLCRSQFAVTVNTYSLTMPAMQRNATALVGKALRGKAPRGARVGGHLAFEANAPIAKTTYSIGRKCSAGIAELVDAADLKSGR